RRSALHLALQVAFRADVLDQALLGFQPVDVLFLVVQDALEQVAADVVGDALAVRDRRAQVLGGSQFQVEVALDALQHVLADAQLAQVLQVRQAVEEQDALDQAIGVLHLLDRFLVLVLGQLRVAPVLEHAVMQKVLVDRGELVVEHLVEEFDDLGVALHGRSPFAGDATTIRTPPEGGQRHRGFVLLDRLRKAGTRLGFAAAAAVRAAGAPLQLRERAHAIGDFAADVVVGDGVAQADVHAAHKNANANDCQLCKWRGRFAVQAARQPCRGSSGVGSPSSRGGALPSSTRHRPSTSGAKWRSARSYTCRLKFTTWAAGYQKSTQRQMSNSGLSHASRRSEASSLTSLSRNQTCF